MGINIPRRGEIWEVDLNPTVGSEMSKARPALVISSDGVGRLAIKIVAPITGWSPSFANSIWLVKIDPDTQNKLSKVSAIDMLQIRGVDNKRFKKQIGKASAQVLEEAVTALAAIVEYQ